MKLTKVSNDENDNSFFEVIGDIPFEENDMLGSLSQTIKVKELLFHEFTDKLQVSWHTPPFGPVEAGRSVILKA